MRRFAKLFEDFIRGGIGYAPSPTRILAAAPSFSFSVFLVVVVAWSSVDIAVAPLPGHTGRRVQPAAMRWIGSKVRSCWLSMVKGGDNYSLGDLGGRPPRSRNVICDNLLNRSNGSPLGAWGQRFGAGGVGGQERR